MLAGMNVRPPLMSASTAPPARFSQQPTTPSVLPRISAEISVLSALLLLIMIALKRVPAGSIAIGREPLLPRKSPSSFGNAPSQYHHFGALLSLTSTAQ